MTPASKTLRSRGRGLTAWICAAALAGCATAPPPGGLSGRLSISVAAHDGEPARSMSAGFELSGDARAGQLNLTSPLGTTVARARWIGSDAVLSRGNGDEAHFASLAELSQAALSEALPLEALFDWLRGRPWPHADSQALAGEPGFAQLGWRVQPDPVREGWISLARDAAPSVHLRVKLDNAP